MAGAAAATVQGGQRAVILFREGRERQRKKAFEESGDRMDRHLRNCAVRIDKEVGLPGSMLPVNLKQGLR